MKQVTTNMSFGQIFFVIGTILTFSAVGFYLGAKFGPRVLQWSEAQSAQASFLPDDEIMTEVKKKLAETNVDYNFFEAVQSKKNITVYALRDEKIPIVDVPAPKAQPEILPDDALALADDLSADSATDKKTGKPLDAASAKTLVASSEKPADKPGENAAQKSANVASEKAPEKIAEKPVDKKTEKPDEKAAQAKALAAAEAKKAEAEKAAQADKPSALAEEMAQTKYLLQTGSFETLKKAEKAKLVWSKRGYDAQIVLAQVGGKQWYRLRLGLYDDYSTIQNHQKNIRSKYNETAMILPIQ